MAYRLTPEMEFEKFGSRALLHSLDVAIILLFGKGKITTVNSGTVSIGVNSPYGDGSMVAVRWEGWLGLAGRTPTHSQKDNTPYALHDCYDIHY